MITPREALEAALEDVEEARVPEHLQEVAFAKAFDLHAGLTTPREPSPFHPVVDAGAGPNDASERSDAISKIASRLGVDGGTVSEVYAVIEDELQLIIPAGKLAGRSATGAKEIALLLAGGRQAAGVEEWTSWDTIREACQEFKRYDSPNFAKTMREMDDVFNERKLSERKMAVRVAKPGWEPLAALVRRFGGE